MKRYIDILVVSILTFAIIILYYTWRDYFPWFWRYFVFEYANNLIGMPIFLPSIYAAISQGLRFSLLAWGFSLLALMPRLILYHSPFFTHLALNLAFLIIPVAIQLAIAIEVSWRRKQKAIMDEREKERQLYTSRILQAQENERRRIAQELHDQTTQELVALANTANALILDAQTQQDYNRIEKRSEWLRDSILRLSDEMKQLSMELRPGILDNIGLVPALRWLVGRLKTETGIDADIEITADVPKLNGEVEVNIFRIVQEALQNIRKHARATRALVKVDNSDNTLQIVVSDNGQGFNVEEQLPKLAFEKKLGLIGMTERARFIKGNLSLESAIGAGTKISLVVKCQSVARVDIASHLD